MQCTCWRSWSVNALVLVAVRWLNQFKPSEPHFVPFLVQYRGLDESTIGRYVLPWSTYSALVATAALGPISYLGGYRAGTAGLVLISALARVATRILLIVGTSLRAIQIAEVLFGITMAGDVALDALLYAIVPAGSYAHAAAYTAAASRLAYLAASEGSQWMLLFGSTLMDLFYVSLVSILLATVGTMFLVWRAVAHDTKAQDPQGTDNRPLLAQGHASSHPSYTSAQQDAGALAHAAVWWLLMYCPVMISCEMYSTNLFEYVDPSFDANGHVTAATSLVRAAVMALVPHLLRCQADMARAVCIGGTFGAALLCWGLGSWVAVGRAGLAMAYTLYVPLMGLLELLLRVVQVQCAAQVGNQGMLFSGLTVASMVIQSLLLMGKSSWGWSTPLLYRILALWALLVGSLLLLLLRMHGWRSHLSSLLKGSGPAERQEHPHDVLQ